MTVEELEVALALKHTQACRAAYRKLLRGIEAIASRNGRTARQMRADMATLSRDANRFFDLPQAGEEFVAQRIREIQNRNIENMGLPK